MTMLKKMIAPSLIAMLGAAGILVASQGAAVASPDNKSYNFKPVKSSSDGGDQMSGSHESMDDHDDHGDDDGYGDSDGHDGGDHDGGDSDGGDSDGGDSGGGDHD